MKKMDVKQLFKIVFVLLLTGFTVVSCDDDEIALEVQSDVIIVSKKIGNVTKRAPAYYVYGNQQLDTATVTPPGGAAVGLKAYNGSAFSLAREPQNSDFSENLPAKGNYAFTVTALNGTTLQNTEAVDFTGIAIPPITKSIFSGTPSILNVEWTTVTGADGYFLKLLNATGKQIFSGYIMVATVNKYVVSGSSTSGSWTEAPEEGQTYTLQVNAITFDDDTTDGDDIYNISELAIGEKQIVWGENLEE